MQLIKPSEISGRILTLLDESDEKVILVSPYVKISKWYKLLNKINKLKDSRIPIEIYVRDDPDNTATFRDLDQLGLRYKKIPNLHSKLYLNERYGIVTSMNLLLTSEINSLEIGYSTETWTEYNDLLAFFHRYIHAGESVYIETISGQSAANLDEFMDNMRKELKNITKISWLWFEENVLHLNTGRNNYWISVNDGSLRISARLRIASVIDQKENHRFPLITKKIEDLSAMRVFLGPESSADKESGILQLSSLARKSLKSESLNGILEAESAYLVNSIVRFIAATHDLVI
jgi:hypothetical protein